MPTEEQKDQARRLFIEGRTNRQISEEVGVSEYFIKRWALSGDWVTARAAEEKKREKGERKQKAKHDERRLAQQLFMRTDMTLEEIAGTVGVHTATLGEWKREGKWTELKASELSTKAQAIANLYEAIARISEMLVEKARAAEDTASLSDQLSKLGKQLSDMEGSIPLTAYVDVLEEFIGFIPKGPDRKKMAAFQQQFLLSIAKGKGVRNVG